MPKRNDAIQNYNDLIEDAKESAFALIGKEVPDAIDVFYLDNLEQIEKGIRALNEYGAKCWLISAIALYSMVYDSTLYRQSGLTWQDYIRQSRERLGMDAREISESLSAARFFIKYHDKLLKAGWEPTRKITLARAELAVELSGDLDATIEHLARDSWRDFKSWYESFKNKKFAIENLNSGIKYELSGDSFLIDGNEVLVMNGTSEYKNEIKGYLEKIIEAKKSGYEPAIIPVYDSTEAGVLLRLRDNNRKKK